MEEKYDKSKWTTENTIQRLIQSPQASVLNLNPYEVLGLDSASEGGLLDSDVKKRYRFLSRLVHPDRNPGNDLAKRAFELINAAQERLKDDDEREHCLTLIADARERLDAQLEAQRRALTERTGGQLMRVPEDEDPALYRAALRLMIIKTFHDFHRMQKTAAEMDQARQMREATAEADKKREAKEKLEEARKWNDGRDQRAASWRDFGERRQKKHKKREKRTDPLFSTGPVPVATKVKKKKKKKRKKEIKD